MAGPVVRSTAPPAAAALTQLDEAFHLLRRGGSLLFYSLFGTLPFGLGVLYFWSDMSRSAFAPDRCVAESLALALLYVWMKVWQARFATALHAAAAGIDDGPWPLPRFLRAAAQQAAIHSTAVPVLLAASVVLLPSAWCVAFYQSAVLYGNGERRSLHEIARRSWQQARLLPLENHVTLAVLSLCALFAFLEAFLAILFLPQVLRIFTGSETVFTRSGPSALNSTLFAVAGVLCYTVVDPLVRAVYVLRCFHGDATRTGADLRLALHLAQERRRRCRGGAALLAVVLLLGPALGSRAAAPPDPPAGGAPLRPADVEQAVRRVLQEPRYSWRLPRTRPPEDPSRLGKRGLVRRFLDHLREWLRRAAVWCRAVAHDAWQWLRRLLRLRQPDLGPARSRGSGWQAAVPYVVAGATVVVIAGLALLAWRAWPQRRAAVAARAELLTAGPGPAEEDLAADRRPPDGWLDVARQLVDRGELRLGLRAAYLASLALLAERRLLTLARHKSNLDYRRELARRAAWCPDVIPHFAANVAVFDRVWYGEHPVTREQIDAAMADVERLRTASEP